MDGVNGRAVPQISWQVVSRVQVPRSQVFVEGLVERETSEFGVFDGGGLGGERAQGDIVGRMENKYGNANPCRIAALGRRGTAGREMAHCC